MWWLAVAMAADPSVDVVWRGGDGRLHVRPPEGEHVAEEAPFDLDVMVADRQVARELLGSDVRGGLSLGDVRGAKIQGTMALSLCEDAGSRCRLVQVSIGGAVPDERRGTVALKAGPVDAAVDVQGFPARQDAMAIFEAAQGESAEQRAPLLLDFGAIWCPPCNLMNAEVFHVRPRPAVVDGFVLATVDVDDPSSWPLKDRFHVSGYPTIVALDPAGVEIGRLVGYPGLDGTVQWLDDVLTGEVLRPEGAPTPHQAARLAWQLVREDKLDEARTWVKVGAAEPESVELRLARLAVEPSADDVRWLAERAADVAMQWVPNAIELARQDPTLKEAVLGVIRGRVVTAPAMEAADLLELSTGLLEGEEATLAWASAARIVKDQLKGDPGLDKGWYGSLSWLLEQSGQPAEALVVLERASAAFPDEPTFHAAIARLHLRQERPEQALVAAEEACEQSWGDNLLTSTRLRAEALIALGRLDEARKVVRAALAEVPAPAAGTDVRTHRYRSQLEALVAPK